MRYFKDGFMARRFSTFSTLLVLASAGGLAHAGTVRGPAGSLELPDGIETSVAPANPDHPNLKVSAVVTLLPAAPETRGPILLTMTCAPVFGALGSAKGMERLAAATNQMDKALKPEKAGEWIKLDSLPAYRFEAVRSDATRLTQWLVLGSTSFAWVKFDRPQDTPIDPQVLDAVAGMKILCGADATPTAPREG
ncbi:TPA: hypothetical protein ACOENR_002575 [Stenotrophomonas maltophilia]